MRFLFFVTLLMSSAANAATVTLDLDILLENSDGESVSFTLILSDSDIIEGQYEYNLATIDPSHISAVVQTDSGLLNLVASADTPSAPSGRLERYTLPDGSRNYAPRYGIMSVQFLDTESSPGNSILWWFSMYADTQGCGLNCGNEVNLFQPEGDVSYSTFNDFPAPRFDDVSSSAVPVPAAIWLFGSAMLGLGFIRRKQST